MILVSDIVVENPAYNAGSPPQPKDLGSLSDGAFCEGYYPVSSLVGSVGGFFRIISRQALPVRSLHLSNIYLVLPFVHNKWTCSSVELPISVAYIVPGQFKSVNGFNSNYYVYCDWAIFLLPVNFDNLLFFSETEPAPK